jgi:menaquinone-dependent protoporphyrinogen IX oxidase
MKIGIIVHSQTGNTRAVAQKLLEKFQEAGHSVNVEQLKQRGGDNPGAKTMQVENPPDAGAYDALVFGAPVHAFSLSRLMRTYLGQVPSLQGKKVACFVTKGLRFTWTGGSQAIAKMTKLAESRGATVCATGIIVWNDQRDAQIAAVTEIVSRCFKI